MRNLERRIRWKGIVESKPILLFLGVLVLVFAWSVIRFSAKLEETGRNKKIAEDKVAALREKKEKLSEDIESLNTDEGKEEFFRENYGLAKEGEQMIVVVEEKKPMEDNDAEASSGFMSFFKNWFR